MKKRLFAGLLSLLMLWTMLPVSALAVGDETIENQDAYFYVLKPESNNNPGTTQAKDFSYVGKGQIHNAPDPLDEYDLEYSIEEKKDWTFTKPSQIDPITYGDELYIYTEDETFVSAQ